MPRDSHRPRRRRHQTEIDRTIARALATAGLPEVGERVGQAVGRALDGLRGAALAPTAPLMSSVLAAVRVRGSVGEMADVLRETWGVYRPV